MDIKENWESALDAYGEEETMCESFALLDSRAKENFTDFLTGLVRILCDDGVSYPTRAAAAKEICRHLSSPSKAIRRFQKEKWDALSLTTKVEIKAKLVSTLKKLVNPELINQLALVMEAVSMSDGEFVGVVVETLKEEKDGRDVHSLKALFKTLGGLSSVVSTHLNKRSGSGKLQPELNNQFDDLVKIFGIGLQKPINLEVGEDWDDLLSATLQSFKQIIEKIHFFKGSKETSFNVFLKKIIPVIQERELLSEEYSENVRIDTLNLLMNILETQIKMKDFKKSLPKFWENLLKNGLQTQLHIFYAKCHTNEAKKVFEHFHKVLDPIFD